MNAKREGFTIHDLEELSGFDRRTIAYYTQEGLLPKVGRRGRGTVYPEAFKERLMFIRAVRDLQDAGSLRAVTLAEVKVAMAALDTQAILDLLRSSDSYQAIRTLFSDPDWDTREIAISVEEVVGSEFGDRASVTLGGENSTLLTSPSATTEELKETSALTIQQLVQKIENAAEIHECREEDSEPQITKVLTAALSPHISITVNGLDDNQARLFSQLIVRLRNLP